MEQAFQTVKPKRLTGNVRNAPDDAGLSQMFISEVIVRAIAVEMAQPGKA